MNSVSKWDEIYEDGSIHKTPSKEVASLVPLLEAEGAVNVLDAGCGTGRHADYLAKQGFRVHAIDVSAKAIWIAKQGGAGVDYRVGTLTSLPYASASMDFILASHVLEYNSEDSLAASAAELDRVLKPGRPILIRVASTKHVFCGASPTDIYGFSHIGFCIKNGLPVHFFTDTELRLLFKGYRVERLEHVSHRLDHERITVPLSEWVMLAYKPAA